MTTPTQPLTPEQINVLIADSLGWTEIETLGEGPYNDRCWAFYTDEPNGFADDTYKLGSIVGKYNPKAKLGHIPNFHGSLDACATFEAGLTHTEFARYTDELWAAVEARHRAFVSATAPQRCLAYIKTKGLIK